jgi:hypothetical protein
MSVRAKMRCTRRSESTSVCTSNGSVESVEVHLQPVYGTGEDDSNKEWSKWTPSGEVRMVITNPEAYNQFEVGKTYFVDFIAVD